MNIPSEISKMRNNCTLVAVHEVSRKPAEEIFKAFRNHGYKDNKGMVNHQWIGAARELGLELEEVNSRRDKNGGTAWDGRRWSESKLTLGEFIKIFVKGVYLISVQGHALVVREGKVIDKNYSKLSLRRRVYVIHRVLNPTVVEELTSGLLHIRIRPYNAKRWGTASYYRYEEMYNYLENNPKATIQEIYKNTKYTSADFKHDFAKGLINYK